MKRLGSQVDSAGTKVTMKHGATFVNVSRGNLVEEAARRGQFERRFASAALGKGGTRMNTKDLKAHDLQIRELRPTTLTDRD